MILENDIFEIKGLNIYWNIMINVKDNPIEVDMFNIVIISWPR